MYHGPNCRARGGGSKTENLWVPRQSNEVLDLTPIEQSINKKINKLDLIRSPNNIARTGKI